MTISASFTPTTPSRSPIATWLVSGFLGAGKTTFILERLKRKDARIAVLVNEFGEFGMDGDLIREKGGIDVVEMPGGCICCSQKDGLAESIRRIALKLRPELLLIEPSGIAETSELIKILTAPHLSGEIRLDATIVLLDAETFLEYSEPDVFGTFFLDQVIHADLILVNKSDLVDAGKLAAVERRIAGITPDALVQRTAFSRMEGEPSTGRERPKPGCSAPLPSMECISVVPSAELTEPELVLFLAKLHSETFGRVHRGKGFLPVRGKGCLNLQIVSGRVTLEPFTESATPRLTLIGYRLDGELLRAFFRPSGIGERI